MNDYSDGFNYKAIEEDKKKIKEFFKDKDISELLVDKDPIDDIMHELREKYEEEFLKINSDRDDLFEYADAGDAMEIFQSMYPVHEVTINHRYCLEWDKN